MGDAKLGSPDDPNFEDVLAIIAGGSLPRRSKRNRLTPGQARQLRDAMIFVSHVGEGHDIFVTNDLKGFINCGRREKLQSRFNTTIMTGGQFRAKIKKLGS